MNARAQAVFLAAALIGAAAAANAAPASPASTPAVTAAPAADTKPAGGFFRRLFGGKPQAQPAANAIDETAAPTEGAIADAETAMAGTTELPPVRVAAKDIPLPRLRPGEPEAIVVTLPKKSAAQTFTAGVTYETTGSIGEPAPPNLGKPQPGQPAQAQPVPTPAPQPVAAAPQPGMQAEPATSAAPTAAIAETAPATPPASPSLPPSPAGDPAAGVRAVGPTPPPFVASHDDRSPPAAAIASLDTAESRAGDTLLGDPAPYFPVTPDEMAPAVAAPAELDHPRRASEPEPAAPILAQMPGVSVMPPFQMVRTMQSVQDAMAEGSTKAMAAQRILVATIEKGFALAPATVWQDRRNAEGAVIFVLSGGNPDVLERLSKLDPKPAVDPRLVDGVLAYARGDAAVAAANLSDLDPQDLPASMAAPIAITQSALAVRTDPKRAMELLSTARLLAPGTLVEEAAIRRQIFIADQLRDSAAVESLARQYLDRFRHSVYAGNFRLRFAAALSHMETINTEADFPRLDDMLASVEPDARCELYLTVALASALKSQFVAARLAAERALTMASPGTEEEARARLYHAAALVADPKGFDTAKADLEAADARRLAAADRDLKDMVEVTLTSVASGTNRGSMPKTADLPTVDPNAKPDPLTVRAGDAIKAVDELLKAAS